MAEKGIIIDVGFAPQWKDFLDSIEKELSKLDLDKYLNLDKAFEKQSKEVRIKLKQLKTEIDQIINGVGQDPIKAFNELNKSVKSLSGVVLNMAKAMPDGAKYAQEINSITNSIDKLETEAHGAVSVLEELNSASTNKLQFKEQLNQIRDLYGLLEKATRLINNNPTASQSDINKYVDNKEQILSELKAEYQKYLDINNQIEDIQDDTALSTESMNNKLDSAYRSLAETVEKINKTVSTIAGLGMGFDIEIEPNFSIQDVTTEIDSQIEEIRDYLNRAKARLQDEFTQLGGDLNLSKYFSKRVAANQDQEKISIPVAIDENSRKKLLTDTINLIQSVQSKIKDPILVEVQLVSAYQARGNQKLLAQIQDEINNIDDGEVTEKLRGLIDKMNKRVENALMFNIYINTQNATNQIRHFKKEIKEEISDIQRLLTVNPEFEITPEIRQKLIDSINEITSLYKLTIDVDFDFQPEELTAKIENISNFEQTLLELKQLLEDIDSGLEFNNRIDKLSISLEKLVSVGDKSDKLINLLKELKSSLQNLSNNKSSEKIESFTNNLKLIKDAIKPLSNIKDNSFLSSIQDILAKGDELKTFAEILKSTKQELANTKDVLSSGNQTAKGNLYLENYSDVIKERALNNISDIDYKLMSQSLEATSEGLVKVTTLIKTADGEYKKYIHTSTDGEEIQQQKIESGTASILKQAQAIERLNQNAKDGEALKKIGEVTPGTDKWQELVDLIESFGIKLKDVTKIIQTVDEEGYESFQVFHGDNLRTTLGINSKDILYEKNNIADLTETTKEFESIIKKLPAEFKKAFKDNGLGTGTFIKDIQKLLELFQKLRKLSDAGLDINIDDYRQEITNLQQSISNIFKFDQSSLTENFEQEFVNIRDDFLGLFKTITQGTSMSNNEIQSLVASLGLVGKEFDQLKDKSNNLANQKSIANILKTVRTELFKNGAMDKEYKFLLEQYRDELQSALELYGQGREKEANLTKERLQEIIAGVMDIQGKIQESGKTGLTMINKIGQAIKTNFAQYVARYFSLYDIIRYIRTSVEEVKNLDTALTELRKVSNETTERLQVSFKQSAETAKELGNTLSYVINITADWSRLGFAIDEAEELARVTTLFKNVGDNMSADDASSYMISTLQGFQITAEKSEEIVDKFNEVANNYAIDTRGIGEALQRSAASFNAANTSLSGAIAVVTTANEVVQNPEMVGTAMKTLSARIRGSKVELEELGDEEANVVDLTSKLRSEVKAMTGFDIMLDEDTYKSIDEIIIGIGEHWDELTDIQQAALAEDLAGKRNSNVMIALLQNAEKVKDVYKTAEESAGSAQREQENYAKSIMYSIDRVKATWSEMIANILKSQDVKKLIDASADALTKLGDTAEKLSAPLTNIMKLLGMIANALATIISIGDGIPAMIGLGGLGIKKIYDKFASSQKKQEVITSVTQTAANEAEAKSEKDLAVSKAGTTQASIAKTVAEKAENAEGVKSIAVKEGEAVASKKSAIAKMAEFAASNKILIITGLIVAAIAAVAAGIYAYIHRLDIKIKKDKKALEIQKKKLESIEQELKTTSEQIDSLNELSKAYENAVEGSQEYYDIANKIAELQPSLVIGYDENGNAILTNTDNINNQIEALKELRREQLEQKRFEAEGVINSSATLIDSTGNKKEKLEQDLANTRDELEQAKRELKAIEEELGDQKGGDDRYINARDAVNAYQKTYEGLVEELKNTSQDLRDAKQEWSSNLAYLFDDIPSTLSDEEKEYEKSIRQFAIDIANSSEEAMDSIDFLALYNNLKSDSNKDILSALFDVDSNLSRQKYKEEAEKVYAQLIQSLADSDFELDEKDQLSLRVALKIDDASEKDYNNRKNRFTQALGASGVKSRQAQSWYDQLSPEDIKVVEKNIDDLAKSVDGVSAENFVSSLDEALKLIKEVEKETEKLSDFTPQDLSEKVTSQLTSIESLYGTFYENILNGSKTRLDLDDVEGLRSALVETGEQAGVTGEQFEEFERIVSDGTHSAQEMQDAFDILSTQFVDATLSLNGYTSKNKELIKAQLEEAGYTKESVDAYVEYKTALHEVDEAVQNNLIHINSNVQAMLSEAEAAGIDKSALIEYYTTKLTADMLSMSTVEDVIQLANELEALGINCDKLREYIALKQTAGSIEATTGFNGTTKNTSAMIAQQKGQTNVNPNGVVQDLQKQLLDNINLVNKTTKESAGGGGKEAGDAYVEAFENELKELDELRDAGVISEKEYLDRLKALYIKYFANRKEYLKQFKQYEKQYLEGMKSLYESAISGAITLLNDQIDELEKAKEDAVEALEEARKNETEPIQDRIDALEDERDAMQKANEQRERALNLQKAQYELERANSQRTRLIYKNGQMQYVQDYQEVRNAKENVEDTLFDMKIGELDDEIDDLNKQLDDINEKYDKLIEETEKFYDDQIKGLQDMIDMWEELQHQAELIEVYEALNALGISAEDILSGNLDVFNSVRDGYIGTLAGLHADTDAVAQAFGITTENAEALKNALLGYDEATQVFSNLKDDISGIADAATEAATALGGGGGGVTGETAPAGEGTGSGTPSGGESSGDSSSLSAAIDSIIEKEPEVQGFADKFANNEDSIKAQVEEASKAIADEDSDESYVNALVRAQEATEECVPEMTSLWGELLGTIAECIASVGSFIDRMQSAVGNATGLYLPGAFTGTAYARGNWSAKSKGINGVALTGELGQELVVDSKTGRWYTVGDHGAEFAHIKPNDIIFNHQQTEELFKNGKIKSRGKSYASGNNNQFTSLTPEELSKYTKLDFTKDLAEKLDFGNQKLMNIDKTVSTISNNKTVNNNPVINVNNPTFTCTGVTGDEVIHQIEQSFAGLFTNAYQQSMIK